MSDTDREELSDRLGAAEEQLEEHDRTISGLRAALTAAQAENARLTAGGRQLAGLLSMYVRSLYAVWIDLRRDDVQAAMTAISEGLDGFDGPEWDGTETGVQWLERTRGQDGEAEAPEDPAVVRDLLLVAGEDVPLEVISGWTAATRTEVADWATAVHLAASDNPVTVPDRPTVLGGGQ